MSMNEEAKENAEKAIEKANIYLENRNFEKAERMANKAQRLFPSGEVSSLLDKIQRQKSGTGEEKDNKNNTQYSFTLRCNLEDAQRCIEVAQQAIISGDLEKATRMLNKAERLHPSTRAKDLLKQIDERTRKRQDELKQVQAMRRVSNAGHNPYKILDLPKNCDVRQVRSAYHHLAKLLHPDKNKQPGAKEAFILVINAMEKLVRESKNNRGK